MTLPLPSPKPASRSAAHEFSISLRSDPALIANALLALVSTTNLGHQLFAGHFDHRTAAYVTFAGLYFACCGFSRSHAQSFRHLWAYAMVLSLVLALLSAGAVNPAAEMAPCLGFAAIAFFLWQWLREDAPKPDLAA